MSKWTKKTYKLDAMYGWECKPGYTIFVADRGAVRFDFPEDWIFHPGDESGSILKFHDREPPDDDCVLQVSIFRLPPGMPWNDAPLTRILSEVATDPEPGETQSPLIAADRGDIDLLWRESCKLEEGRPACSRQCLARGNGVMVLMTLDFWTDDAPRVIPVWDEILRSLRLGEYVRKPGPRR